MNFYADTSFLLSLYREQTSSSVANRIIRRAGEAMPLTPLMFLEMRNGLNLALFRGEIDAATRDAAWAHVQQDIRDGVLVHVSVASTALYDKAAVLSDTHGATVGARTLDVLHVASAVILDAKEFLTFDRRQRSVAEKAGLAVKP